MQLVAFDHVNILTGNLDEMVLWYDRVLGLKSGDRPDFATGGAWLYLGDHPYVHLVVKPDLPKSVAPQIEHFAFTADGMAEFLARLDQMGIASRLAEVPGTGITQVNVSDPDGNHIHIDFQTGPQA